MKKKDARSEMVALHATMSLPTKWTPKEQDGKVFFECPCGKTIGSTVMVKGRLRFKAILLGGRLQGECLNPNCRRSHSFSENDVAQALGFSDYNDLLTKDGLDVRRNAPDKLRLYFLHTFVLRQYISTRGGQPTIRHGLAEDDPFPEDEDVAKGLTRTG